MSTDELRNVENTEFFFENMAMLGFPNKSQALIMAVKEAVDNALDATEEIEVLPDIKVSLEDVGDDMVLMEVEDNAGGLPLEEVENVFGEILYSSRFGRWKQSRGQQGIGISAVHLWSQKFQNRPTYVRTKQPGADAYEVELKSSRKGKDTEVVAERKVEWSGKDHGTLVRMYVPANWRSRPKLHAYLEGTNIANPSARIIYNERGTEQVYPRTTDEPPEPPDEMPPHPNAVDTGMLDELIPQTDTTQINQFLQQEFHRVDKTTARRILRKTDIDPDNPFLLDDQDYEGLVTAMREVDTYAPGTDALSPLGEELVETALQARNPEFIGTDQRDSITIDGHPTVIETGIAYGGDIEGGPADYYRVANRVPLVYDASGCALANATQSVTWPNYELEEDSQGAPVGPAVVFVHICSTQVNFGNEAKTFVASHPKIEAEIKRSLEECGRQFSKFVREQERRAHHRRKVEKMVPIYTATAEKLETVTGNEPDDLYGSIGRSCSTVVVGEDTVYNPTEKTRSVTVDGEEVELTPGERIEYNDEVDYVYEPVHE